MTFIELSLATAVSAGLVLIVGMLLIDAYVMQDWIVYVALGLYIVLLMACYVAGCPSIARDNEQIKEGD